MRVALITHFYPPEPCAAATRVASLVDALAHAGHDVTVITNFPSFPASAFSRSDRGCMRRTERTAHGRVVRLGSLLARGLPGARIVHWASAGFAAAACALLTRRRYDTVIVSMPPVTLAVPALVAAWRHRARLVVDVRDVFPDIAIAMGEWRSDGVLARTCEWLVRRLYRRANLIVAVTPTALAQIAGRGIAPGRLVLARNAAEDVPVMAPAPRAPDAGFTATYAGNFGLASDLDVLLDAAAKVAPDGISIELIGDGAQRAHLAERVRNESLSNVAMRASMPRSDAMRAIAQADVSIVSLRRGIEESVPTKLYDSISMGCPVIVVAGGEAQREGTALGAECAPAGDADALADALRRLSRLDRNELRRIGQEGADRLRARAGRAGIMTELAGRISALA